MTEYTNLEFQEMASEMMNSPKRQYLHFTTTTTPAASTSTPSTITCSTTLSKTTSSMGSTT